jgi:hypothetical protein
VSEKNTCGVETNALRASLSVQADGPTTKVYAALFGDGNVDLGCGDAFSATVGSEHLSLSREPSANGAPLRFTATLTSPSSPTPATIAFERPPPKAAAASSKVYLPGPFAVRDVTPNVKLSAKEDLQFRVDPPIKADVTEVKPDSVQLRLVLEGPCLEQVTFTWSKSGVLFPPLVKADGSVVLVNGSQFFKRVGNEPSCDVSLVVSELTAGEIDPAFAGSLQGGYPAEGSRHERATFHLEW